MTATDQYEVHMDSVGVHGVVYAGGKLVATVRRNGRRYFVPTRDGNHLVMRSLKAVLRWAEQTF